MTQGDLLTSFVLPRDSHVTEPEEIKRLSGQSLRIIARLEQGPATNRELAEISLKYTARVSDARPYLRRQGKDIKVIEQNRKTGYALYAIRPLEQGE